MEMVYGLEWDDHEAASFRVPLSAPWRRAAMSDVSDTSEGESTPPSSASASDSDPDAAWGKDETAMDTRERLGLGRWGGEAELIERGDEYEDDQYTSAVGGA